MRERIYKMGDTVRAKFQINVIPKGSFGTVIVCGCDPDKECVQFKETTMHFSPVTIGWVERAADADAPKVRLLPSSTITSRGWVLVPRAHVASSPDDLALSLQLARALAETEELRAAKASLEAERNDLLARNAKLADVAATRDEIDAHRARLMDENIKFRRELERAAPNFIATYDRNRGKK
jgi:hypothetical protein